MLRNTINPLRLVLAYLEANPWLDPTTRASTGVSTTSSGDSGECAVECNALEAEWVVLEQWSRWYLVCRLSSGSRTGVAPGEYTHKNISVSEHTRWRLYSATQASLNPTSSGKKNLVSRLLGSIKRHAL